MIVVVLPSVILSTIGSLSRLVETQITSKMGCMKCHKSKGEVGQTIINLLTQKKRLSLQIIFAPEAIDTKQERSLLEILYICSL